MTGVGSILSAYTRGGGVSCEAPLACAAGARVLAGGGNAVDAFIATSLALAVVVPHLGGLGGDLFAMVREPDGGVRVLNASGPSPRGLTLELVRERLGAGGLGRSPLSVTVPGMVLGLHELWRRYGSMEWERLVEPALRLARDGFPAGRTLHDSIERHRSLLARDPGSRRVLLERAPSAPWSTVRFPELARVLEEIAVDPHTFYTGWPAESIAGYVRERGGVLSPEDMRNYRPIWQDPLTIEVGEWNVHETPPNSQGVTSLHILALLPWGRLPRGTVGLARHIIDAAIPAYRLRDMMVGDPRWMSTPPGRLLDPSLIESLAREAYAASGKPCTTAPRGPDGRPGEDTTALLAVDGEGLLVVGVQSLFNHWGSTLTDPRTGVTLNNRATGFTLEPGLPNTLGPGKRPLHTLSTLLAEGPAGTVALATSGGHYRPQQHALMLARIIEHGASVGEAIAAPRILWEPGTCRLVSDTPDARLLEPLGFEVRTGRTGVAVGIIAYREGGAREIAADPRGEGAPYIFP